MAAPLKIVSGVYPALICLLFSLAVVASGDRLSGAMGLPSVAANVLAFVICIMLSIRPWRFFLRQVVGGGRAMRRHVPAMHADQEPGTRP